MGAFGPEDTSVEQKLCYRRRASEGGCAGHHTLRSFWMNSLELPGAIYQPYAPHHNLRALMEARWLHTFSAEASSGVVLQVLRDYEEFVEPPPVEGTPAALLEFRL